MLTIWFASFPTSNRENVFLIQLAIMELFWGITVISFLRITPPETNIAPENGPSQ